MIGQTLGHYTVESQLGSGGMGAVYLAYDGHLHRRVAIKVLTGLVPGGAEGSLLREARAASALNHANICTIHEVSQADGRPFIVMEYVEGRRLAEAIPDRGLTLDSVLRYGTQLASALAHAHERGVVHRDLKSTNVVITDPGHVKVLDFGLARRVRSEVAAGRGDASTLPMTGAEGGLVGTLAYMAPEVLRGQDADARSDIWSLGVVLYEMAAGRLPFDGRGTFDLSAAILREPPQPFTSPVPASLRGVILRCLAKEPGQRYRHAEEVAAALEAIQSDVVTGQVAQAVVPAARRRWIAGTAAAAVLVAAAGVVVVRLLGRPTLPDALAHGQLHQLAASEMQARDPAVSPDGKVIAYVAETSGGHFDLFVMRASGGGPIRLTSDDAGEATPRFSPDGERIAFTRRDLATASSEVCVIPTFGGPVTTVVRRGDDASWSKDGSRLAFIRRPRLGEPMALVTIRSDGTEPVVLLRGDGTYPWVRRPTWSPDGRTIAVVRGTGGIAGEIWLVSTEGGAARRLWQDRPSVFRDDPSFTPDGRGLVHSSNEGGAVNLWYLPIDGGPPTRITTGPGPDESPSIAADGRVVFQNTRRRGALIVHEPASAQTRVLLTHTLYVWGPAFSPDGRMLAFNRGDIDGSWHVWTVRVDGGEPTQVTSSAAGEIYPRFTRDGQWLLFHSWKLPHVVWRARRDGGDLAQVTTSPGTGDGFADMSPDGTRIALARSTGGAEGIFTMPAGGGPAVRLTPTPGSVPRWSPDGRSIAFSGDRTFASGVYVIRADGTGERRLATVGGWPVWWPDGRRLGYLIVGADGNQAIATVPVEGGEPQVLTSLRYSGTNCPFDVSPDGTLIATSNSLHVSTELWLLQPAR